MEIRSYSNKMVKFDEQNGRVIELLNLSINFVLTSYTHFSSKKFSCFGIGIICSVKFIQINLSFLILDFLRGKKVLKENSNFHACSGSILEVLVI